MEKKITNPPSRILMAESVMAILKKKTDPAE